MNRPDAVPAPVFRMPVRVYYQDTDAGGVVYHSRYLDFMERARYEWLRSFGYGNRELADAFGVVFVVRSAELEWLKPARLDDLLEVTVRVEALGGGQLTLAQEVLHDGVAMVSARLRLVCVAQSTFRPTRIPAALRAQFTSGETCK